MNYIVFDLEWNMGSPRQELRMMPFEIVEIGAVKLDDEMNETGRFSRLIRPRVYKTMHRINSRIAHITDEDLKDADSFEEVYADFLEFCNDGPHIFCTWGDTDLTELQRNIHYFDCTPLSRGPIEFLDVQKLYGHMIGEPKKRVSLETAVEELELPEDTGFHRAISDATYTAAVFCRTDAAFRKYTSFNCYHTPKDARHEVIKDFGDYIKYISRTFPDRPSLMRSKKARTLLCPVCRSKLARLTPWHAKNAKHYLTLGECPEHGFVKSKLRVKKDDLLDGVYAVKTTKIISAEDKEALQKSILSKSE